MVAGFGSDEQLTFLPEKDVHLESMKDAAGVWLYRTVWRKPSIDCIEFYACDWEPDAGKVMEDWHKGRTQWRLLYGVRRLDF